MHGHTRSGADKGARTPDLDVGNVALYQLSYIRIFVEVGRHPVVAILDSKLLKSYCLSPLAAAGRLCRLLCHLAARPGDGFDGLEMTEARFLSDPGPLET